MAIRKTKKISNEELIKFDNDGLTLTEIAKKKNMSVHAVSLRYKSLGMTPNKRKNESRIVKPFSIKPEYVDTINDIAKKTGLYKCEVVEKAIEMYSKNIEKETSA